MDSSLVESSRFLIEESNQKVQKMRESDRHRSNVKALRKIDTTWNNPKHKGRSLVQKEVCTRSRGKCDGNRPFSYNTKELLEGV